MRLKCVFVLALFASLAVAQQPQQRRVVRPVDNASAVRLQGTLAPRAHADLDRGPVDNALRLDRITIVFSRTPAQQAELDRLLAAQHDPASPDYQKWLTPDEFGDRFGLADADLNLVAAWLVAQGFTVEDIARSRTWIAFSGTAAQVEAAFRAPLHNFVVGGKLHYAPSAEAAVPDAFAPVVAAIAGLNDFRPHPHSQVRHANPRLTSSLSGNHFIAPGDFGTIYNLPDYVNGVFQPGNDGTGQTIGIVGQTSTTGTIAVSTISSDTATFRSVSQLPPGILNLVPVGTPGQFASGDADESNLDVQRAGSVAPGATITLAYSNNALNTSLPRLVQLNPSVISISYGDCEANFSASEYTTIENALLQAQTAGITVTASAGDNAATDCDGTPAKPATIATKGLAVDYPASSQYAVAMGGTQFTGDSTATPVNGVAPAQTYWNSSSDPNDASASALSYIPEIVWNDTASSGTIVGTGGGVSNCAPTNGNNQCSSGFPKPSWQVGTGVPADGHRDLPDLSFSSSSNHDGYLTCSQGSCQVGYRRNPPDSTFTVIGGTSVAAPAMAGVAALINQRLGTRLGNLNSDPTTGIYALAASAPWAFNDITTGDNKAACTVGTTDCSTSPIGYSAAPGYDLATGWGSVNVSALINSLEGKSDFSVTPTATTLSVPVTGTAVLTLNVLGTAGSKISLPCSVSSSLGSTTCSANSVTANGATVVPSQLTITAPANSTASGTLSLQASNGPITHLVLIAVTLGADFSVTSSNSTEAVTTGSSTTDTITITPVQGLTGSVALNCAATAGLTCSLNPNPAVITAMAAVTSTLTVSASTSATTGSVTITATSGGLTHTLQIPVTVTVVSPDFNLTVASPVVSIPSGTAITDNLTVAAVGGFNSDVALTCSVPGSLGTTTCTINPSTVPGGTGTALITLKGAVLSRDTGAPLPFQHRGLGTYATLVFSLGVVFAAKSPRRRKKTRAWRNGLFGFFLMCVMFGALSCGGGGGSSVPPTPTPITGNVTITGIGGGITHTATINVTVH